MLPSPYVGRSPPRLPPAGRAPTDEQLPLPLDYNPVGLLRQLETVNHFNGSSISGDRKPTEAGASESTASTTAITVAVRRHRDLQWTMTLAMELFLPQRFRLLRTEATLEERLQLCRDTLRYDPQSVPRCLRSFIKTVLQNDVVTAQGLPPPSAHQLLQPMVSLIPFPGEFAVVLATTRHLRELLDHVKFDFSTASKSLASLASTPSSLQLLIPYVKALLTDSSTAYHAALYLLDPVAAAIGPAETAKEFLPVILKLMGPEQTSASLAFLYHKRFLLMLQVSAL